LRAIHDKVAFVFVLTRIGAGIGTRMQVGISVDVVVPVMPLKLLADPSSERDIQKFSNVKK
jgi:hypothetical protein